ncbi:MAG TPA: rhodanese-like domain-containing protein [Chryseolinea sp.]|jgi:tRNA 2-selenouridine synthase|nr:rhodanese-like domain-containing protein [Chryseolinea sp.]
MPALDPTSFFFWKNPRQLIDVRHATTFLKGSIENAISIPENDYSSLEDLRYKIHNLQGGAPLHLIDRNGTTSKYLSQDSLVTYLEGGYEAFKKWRDVAFNNGPQLYLIGGYSGSGKTDFLNYLEHHHHQVINLESLSGHKGSTFGSNNPQPLHDTFQNTLLHQWYSFQPDAAVWIEEKGPFLGQVGIPSSLYKKMLEATMIHLDVDFEQRLRHIMETYHIVDVQAFRRSIQMLEERMGTSQNHKALHFYDNGQKEYCFELLLRYYDRAYEKRREKYCAGKIVHIKHAHDDPAGTLEKIQMALQSFA